MSAHRDNQRLDWAIFDLPRGFIYAGIVVLCLALVPPALILRARAVPTDKPRIHLIQNMDNQPSYRAQQGNIMFKDGRAMRPRVAGTVSRSQMVGDTAFHLGTIDGEYVTTFPEQVNVDDALLVRGRDRYEIFCLPCHGVTGLGNGPVHDRAMMLLNNGTNGTIWVQPRNYHQADMQTLPPGRIFYTISNGFGNMAGYASQIPVEDRWAIVSWVYALQVARNAPSHAVDDAESLPVKTRSLDDDGGTP